jgi:predicted hydrolase (HD superfamily)
MPHIPDRNEALALLEEFNQSPSLINHALAVEAIMRRFAGIFGEDAEKWGIIGLTHDLDYERFAAEHCVAVKRILNERDWPEDYIHAVQSHGWPRCVEVKPEHPMEKTLYAIDELSGLIAATAMVRPSKSVRDVEVKSVKKKWNQKAFAAGVDRDVIAQGVAMMGKELDWVIGEALAAMQSVAAKIGL